jgi:hypothetical protein
MAWLTSVTLHTTSTVSWSEHQYRVFAGTVDTYYRIHTLTTEECDGVDESTATTYVANNPADPTANPEVKSCRAVRSNEAGAYRVIKETESVGSWTKK